MQKDKHQKIIGIFILFLVLLNFPFIGLFGKSNGVLNIPKVYAYVFWMWFLLIVLMYRIIEKK
jgi:hypothetical protein